MVYTARRETLWIFKKLWECWLPSESTVNILEFYWSVCTCTNHQLKNAQRPPSLFVFSFSCMATNMHTLKATMAFLFFFFLELITNSFIHNKFIYSSHQKFLTARKIPRFFWGQQRFIFMANVTFEVWNGGRRRTDAGKWVFQKLLPVVTHFGQNFWNEE